MKGDTGTFYEALEKKTAGNIRGTISNASHLSQSIVLKTMLSPDYQKERLEKVELLKNRALKVKEVLTKPQYADAWDPYPFNSGYFMCLRIKNIDAEKLRQHLLEKYKVGVISIGSTDLRIAFSSVDVENIEPLFESIYQAVMDLEKEA